MMKIIFFYHQVRQKSYFLSQHSNLITSITRYHWVKCFFFFFKCYNFLNRSQHLKQKISDKFRIHYIWNLFVLFVLLVFKHLLQHGTYKATFYIFIYYYPFTRCTAVFPFSVFLRWWPAPGTSCPQRFWECW